MKRKYDLDLFDTSEVVGHLVPELRATQAHPAGDVLGGDGVLTGILIALENHMDGKHCFYSDATRIPLGEDGYIAAKIYNGIGDHCTDTERAIHRLAALLHKVRGAWRQGKQYKPADSFENMLDALVRLSQALQKQALQESGVAK